MKFSYKELQKYIKSPLPKPEDLARELTLRAFEVEDIESKGDDFLIEVKILPDREDCKNPKGLAREIAAVFDLLLEPGLLEKENHAVKTEIEFSIEEINSILGLNLNEEDVIEILKKLRVDVEKKEQKLIAYAPNDRKDLKIMEDLADEVARFYSIDKIPNTPLSFSAEKLPSETNFALSNTLRKILLEDGFTEIYGYTLAPNGEIEIEKPLATDKAFLRTNLSEGLKDKLRLNLQNVFFDNEIVKIFEIGTVFPKRGVETVRLGVALGYKPGKTNKDLPQYLKHWGGEHTWSKTEDILEFDLEDLKNKIDWRKNADLSSFIKSKVKYESFSLFPRIIRDLALWVDEGIGSEEVADVIRKSAGELLSEGPILFDEFKKGDKTSYAFRMAFQASDRTLTDEEVNQKMDNVYQAVKSRGWEVR